MDVARRDRVDAPNVSPGQPGAGHVLLDVRDLHASYDGAVRALAGVSLSVPEGAVVAVLGNNGYSVMTLQPEGAIQIRGFRKQANYQWSKPRSKSK